jgi:hypothetical protein
VTDPVAALLEDLEPAAVASVLLERLSQELRENVILRARVEHLEERLRQLVEDPSIVEAVP